MMNGNCPTPDHNHGHFMKCFSWSAVIVGALVGIGLSFLLNLFSVAIGLSMVNTTAEGAATLAIGGFVGLIIGGIVAMFLSGFAAGYLGRPSCKHNLGLLYGFTTWSLALILMAILTAHMGRYVSFYSNFAANPSTTVIVDNVNPNMPLATQTTNSDVVVNAQKATTTLGISAFLIFILFFIGAISCCIGAHCGMSCREKCCNRCMPNEIK